MGRRPSDVYQLRAPLPPVRRRPARPGGDGTRGGGPVVVVDL
ncbi:hypothetical protein Ae168Ps1_4636c [Pseudonocardia sp. Ae168_Ps1]|nr:hypothetical protein Ae150APs1_4609c [Pseudonocardia sp. Ae150A_Ps1]OLL82230.1 hypothetical protein Ae168Ps1_4636c [Pseudonocardia sp. Ae168_Ps1]OLL83654.1 hypothetical protein Ae263Ps1_0709 [Pseudonocardia sp. Ae263_Ps1]OLL90305.1 hypothetical protein Ae356Ps1_0202c [Pseudonocardia sp. Ae356_Ps1]